MKIFKKYKFINRFAKNPRGIFSHSKAINLTTKELDIIFKLQNYNIDNNKITPNLTKLSERSGISIRTYQRAFSSLKEKGYIELIQNKDELGKFSTNSYDFSGLLKKLDGMTNQLYIDFDSGNVFGGKSSSLVNCSYVAVPKVLDYFQDHEEIKMTQKENLFIKYLCGYLDDSGVSEISLNLISKTTPLTRTILQKVVKSLSERGLIKVKEQFHGRTKIRVRNRYDLTPLFDKLNELERKKAEEKMKIKGLWKDFTKKREFKSISRINQTEEKKVKKINVKGRIAFLENEIRRLQPELISKYSETAELIRSYQLEINELKYVSSEENSIANLLKARLKKISEETDKDEHTQDGFQAKMICDKLNGNWNRSYNMYMKAVRMLPGTVDRFVGHALEKGSNKERYFARCVSNEFKKLTLV